MGLDETQTLTILDDVGRQFIKNFFPAKSPGNRQPYDASHPVS
jgi:hypothetical protein